MSPYKPALNNSVFYLRRETSCGLGLLGDVWLTDSPAGAAEHSLTFCLWGLVSEHVDQQKGSEAQPSAASPRLRPPPPQIYGIVSISYLDPVAILRLHK